MARPPIHNQDIFFITTNVHDRRWFFVTPKRAEVLGRVIRTCCVMKGFELFAYCILPDHIHLLVQKVGGKTTSQGTLESMPWDDGENNKTDHPERMLSSVRSGIVEILQNVSEERMQYLFSPRRPPRAKHLEISALSTLMQSIKGTFSRTQPPGKFWQRRSYIRRVEDDEYFWALIEYIRNNYKKLDVDDAYGQPPFIYCNGPVLKRIF